MYSAAKSRLRAAVSPLLLSQNQWKCKPGFPCHISSASASSTSTSTALLELGEVTEILDDVKAGDVRVIPVQGSCQWTDFMVIATGRSAWHVRNIAQALIHKVKLKQKGTDQLFLPRVEGYEGGKWIVVVSGNVTIHALDEKARAYYNLESLWTTERALKESKQETE